VGAGPRRATRASGGPLPGRSEARASPASGGAGRFLSGRPPAPVPLEAPLYPGGARRRGRSGRPRRPARGRGLRRITHAAAGRRRVPRPRPPTRGFGQRPPALLGHVAGGGQIPLWHVPAGGLP
jgi:hypothetical protein